MFLEISRIGRNMDVQSLVDHFTLAKSVKTKDVVPPEFANFPELCHLLRTLDGRKFKEASRIYKESFEFTSLAPTDSAPIVVLIHKASGEKFAAIEMFKEKIVKDNVEFFRWLKDTVEVIPLTFREFAILHQTAFDNEAGKCYSYLIGDDKLLCSWFNIFKTCIVGHKINLLEYIVNYYELPVTKKQVEEIKKTSQECFRDDPKLQKRMGVVIRDLGRNL